MPEQSKTATSEQIAAALDKITEPMKRTLLSVNGERTEAGMGTWFKLRDAGLLDKNFNITELGRQVCVVIR